MERSQQSRTEAHLLVVDDEPNIRDLLASSLRFAGFEVSIAGDGNGALKTVEKTSPDLVVLDVMLPDMDGFTVARRLRERDVTTPILFLTARDDMADKVQEVISDVDLYERLSLNARGRVEAAYDLVKVNASYNTIYRQGGAGKQTVTRTDQGGA